MADSGRGLVIKKGGTAIAGARTNSLALDNSPVDITNLGSGGFRTLADFSGTRSVDLTISGVWTDKEMRVAAFAADSALNLTDITLDFADGDTLTGDFFLANYSETGAHEDAVTFEATLQSSGTFTFTDTP